MIPAPVEYVRASTQEEAFDALGQPDAKAIAGGQSLLPLMKLRLARPSLLVDVSRLALRDLESTSHGTRLGSLATWDDLARAQELRTPGLAAVAECARGIGDLQIRNRGTIGGGLAHADPASDMPAVVLAFDGQIRLRSSSGERTVAASDFFSGPFETALREDELMLDITLPAPAAASGSAYVSVEHPASGFALAGAAALVSLEGDRPSRCSVALSGVAGRPLSLSIAPAGSDEELIESAAGAARAVDAMGDRYAPSEYRRQLAEVVVRRALARALARARGEDR
jgi:carbon-monoxide dehydrogenase medium subunit